MGAPIVTEVEPLGTFYEAENYHHDYYSNHSNQGYCIAVINPKLEKVQAKYGELLQDIYKK
jgi:peptide methionine sulfoxide reductase MsrA